MAIKNLFAVRNTAEQKEEALPKEDKEQIRITYYQSGFAASTKASGKPIVLQALSTNSVCEF